MDILMVGTGIIGTIYGWALTEGGHNVTHYARTDKPDLAEHGANIDILDERKGHKKFNQTTYAMSMTNELDTSTGFNLIIVPVNSFQVESALKEIIQYYPDSYYFILTSNWKGTEMFDKILPENQYILGYPDGGGTIKDGVYWTNIGPEIHIAQAGLDNTYCFELIKDIFLKAGIKPDVQENMLHWLSGLHVNALNCVKYGELFQKNILKLLLINGHCGC